MIMRYTWDPKKNAANFRKHRVTFEVAAGIFKGFTYEYQDEKFDYEEIRQIAIGFTDNLEFFVVFTDVSEEERRIISARPASRKERKDYWAARGRHD